MSFWHSISILENYDPEIIVSIEKNASLGLTSLYFGSRFSNAKQFHEFKAGILEEVNKVISNSSKTLINQEDRLILINLAYLVHRTLFHNYKVTQANWPSNGMPKKGKCSFPGCKHEGNQMDHIWPRSLGGPNLGWNCQWLCDFHNRMKSNAPIFGFISANDFNSNMTEWMKLNRWI